MSALEALVLAGKVLNAFSVLLKMCLSDDPFPLNWLRFDKKSSLNHTYLKA
jgi:hypothetical protein